jgi:hypothetical protein
VCHLLLSTSTRLFFVAYNINIIFVFWLFYFSFNFFQTHYFILSKFCTLVYMCFQCTWLCSFYVSLFCHMSQLMHYVIIYACS